MTIAGCQRQLPICPISDSLDIAGFVMFGDVEVTEAAAKAPMSIPLLMVRAKASSIMESAKSITRRTANTLNTNWPTR